MKITKENNIRQKGKIRHQEIKHGGNGRKKNNIRKWERTNIRKKYMEEKENEEEETEEGNNIRVKNSKQKTNMTNNSQMIITRVIGGKGRRGTNNRKKTR